LSKQKGFNFPTTKPASNKKFDFPTDGAGFFRYHPFFSFKHYGQNTKDYLFDAFINKGEFLRFFDELRKMSEFIWEDIQIKHSKKYHFHPIGWHETAEPRGLNIPIRDSIAINGKDYQFKTFDDCRVVGFFNRDHVFEIVWIDRHHKVYPHK
jgi:hypothetical protein